MKSYQADPAVKDHEGYTPMDYAKGQFAVMDALQTEPRRRLVGRFIPPSEAEKVDFHPRVKRLQGAAGGRGF